MNSLEAYENDGWAQDLGIQVYRQDAQSLELRLPFHARNLQGEGGVVHGGVIGTLLHDAGALLSNQMYALEPGTSMHTVDFQVNYLRASRNSQLQCQATVLRQARHYAFIESVVTDQEHRVIAQARLVSGKPHGNEPPKVIALHQYRDLLDQKCACDPHPFLGLLRRNLSERRPGFSVTNAGDGMCQIQVENLANNLDYNRNMAVGAQIFAADSAGVFSSFTCGEMLAKAATIDLKLSFCAPVQDDNLIALAQSLTFHNATIHHQLVLFGQKSKTLAALGTMTLSV